MFVRLKNYLLQLSHNVSNSIGAYPALIAFGLCLLAIVFLNLETPELTRYLKEKAGIFIIDNADTARSLLSTLIGGVISLTVFSFSMVMILLNQASSNYSPRLLPGLISNKKHQFVLGFYIGAILFNIVCLINVLPGDTPFQIPAFTILFGILLGPVCLVLFVFFIHSISEAIQVNNILERLYDETVRALEDLAGKMAENRPSFDPETQSQHWYAITLPEYGRLRSISESDLLEVASAEHTIFRLPHPRGMPIMPGTAVLYSSKRLNDEATQEALQCLHFGNQEIISENFLFGFKQLTEIAVRAMSPGINDPGTAMDALDFLTELLARRMRFGKFLSIPDAENTPRLYLNVVSFEDLIYFSFAAIRTYAAHDPVLMHKLLKSIAVLLQVEMCTPDYRRVLLHEQQAIWDDVQKHIENPHDLERLRQALSTDK